MSRSAAKSTEIRGEWVLNEKSEVAQKGFPSKKSLRGVENKGVSRRR